MEYIYVYCLHQRND